jgi:hypothetical protein
MRRAAALLATTALLALPATALAAESFTADLTVDAEVPPVAAASEGSGSAEVTISDDGSEVTYNVSYQGLTGEATAAHIHFGAPGVAGGVMLPLAHGPSPFGGTLTEADFTPVEGGPQSYAEALDAIRDGNAYINIHTEANPPGEIRGQLEAAEMPPTDAAASGVPAGAPSGPAVPAVLLVAAVLGAGLMLRRLALQR